MLFRITDTANLLPLDTVDAATPDEAVTLSAYGPAGVDAVAVDAPRIPMTLGGEGGPFYAITNTPGVWNGWDAPVFPFAEAVRIAEWSESCGGDYITSWDADRGTFVDSERAPLDLDALNARDPDTITDEEIDAPDRFVEVDAWERVSTPYGHGYAIGGYSWVWQETPDADTL